MNLFIPAGIILVVIIVSLVLRQRKLRRKLKELRETWGRIPAHATGLESAKILFKLNKSRPTDDSYAIDDATWHDLDLDEIFSLINRATTPTGAQQLYYLLKHPLLESRTLHKREELISLFADNQELREKVQLTLRGLAENNAECLPYSLWNPLPPRPWYAPVFPIISFIALAVLLAVIFQFLHFFVLIGVYAVNLIIRSLVKRKIDVYIYSFQYLSVLISTARKLATLKSDGLEDIRQSLVKSLKGTRVIVRKILAMQFRDDLGVSEYINSYFLWDITGFYSAIGKIEKHRDELRKMFATVGYLDAAISIASFRLEYDKLCRPQFNDGGREYIVADIYNPLLRTPVTNSFEFDTPNVLITGSNMAGKTTFLKTLGVNAILGQTINTCLASGYKAPFIKVISSIGREDNLVQGKSYYMAEVESILRLLKASKSDAIHLFILDEIFRGTNSVERLAASIEVLDYLANEKDYILVATHDLELTEKLHHKYRNVHFQEQVCDEGLSFDYKLHPGSATTRNAIALLKYVGYPECIVQNATKRISGRG